MAIEDFAEGNALFKQAYFKKHEDEFIDLAESGQHPKALFIGCSDSRVMPSLMIQAKPGDLFVLRNVGNMIPPYKPDEDYHGTAAGIEYAVSVLNVSEIILTGHSHCGAIESLFSPINDTALVHTRKWLELGQKAKHFALLELGVEAPLETKLRLTEKLNIITQLENLLTYPIVKRRIEEERLFLHGWYYDIKSGKIDYYDPDSYSFKPLTGMKAQ